MRLVIRSALTIAALSFLASAAEAATTDANRSRGTADLSWSTRTSIAGPTSGRIGGSTLAVEVSADLDPVKDTSKPFISVDMKGVALEATWNDDKNIEILLQDLKTKDGLIKVEHTLAPHVKLHYDILGIDGTIDYNAEGLLGDLPGSSFNYLGTGSNTFEPWATKSYGILTVTGPALANAQLVSAPLSDLIGTGSTDILTGTLSLNATTTPTFNYSTTEVTVDNAATAITKDKPSYKIPTTDDDFLDLPMLVKGQIAYEGSLFVRPAVTIKSVAGITIPGPGIVLDDVGSLGQELKYSSSDADHKPIPVAFQTVMVHIPLPNVKAARELDFGESTLEKMVTKQTLIRNTGELEAVIALKSSDPQFTVVADRVMKAKEDVNLDIKFTPTKEGVQTAEITVTSNDPNEPVQKITVTGTGTKLPVPDSTEPETKPATDSGCGCRTTGSAPTNYAAFGGVGLALAALIRRRRK
jgi:MYXO-CTERM domain-containing protein